jgi:hypothetical protein
LFMRTFYVVNICLVVISTVDEIHFCFLMWISQSQVPSKWWYGVNG